MFGTPGIFFLHGFLPYIHLLHVVVEQFQRAANYLFLRNKPSKTWWNKSPPLHLLICELWVIVLDWAQLDGSSDDLWCLTCGVTGTKWFTMIFFMAGNCFWLLAGPSVSSRLAWASSRGEWVLKAARERVGPNVLFKPVLALHLLMSYWPKQVTWSRPEPMRNGTVQGCVYKEAWLTGAHYCTTIYHIYPRPRTWMSAGYSLSCLCLFLHVTFIPLHKLLPLSL